MLPFGFLKNYNIAQAAINALKGSVDNFSFDKRTSYPQYNLHPSDNPYDFNDLFYTPLTDLKLNDIIDRSNNFILSQVNGDPINIESNDNWMNNKLNIYDPIRPQFKNLIDSIGKLFDDRLVKAGNIDVAAAKSFDLYVDQYRDELRRLQRRENLNSGLRQSLPAAFDFAGSVYNGFQYDKSSSDLTADAGYGRSNVMGVGYTTQKLADSNLVMKEEHIGNVSNTLSNMAKGAAAGSAFGWIGAAGGAAVGLFSGLLGGGSRHAAARRALEELRLLANRTNTFNRNMAMTTGIQQDFSKKYGNQEGLVLFAKHGADSDEGGTWAKTQFGETKDSDGKLTTYTTGTPGVDSNLDYIKDDDTIFSLETPIGHIMTQLSAKVNRNTGKNLEIANRVARKSVEEAKEGQKELRNLGYLPKEQYGMAKWGIDDWGNLAQSLSGIGTAIRGFLLAKRSAIHRPDIRVADNSQRYVNDLYSLRPDNLSIFRELRNAEARGRYQLASAGGLGAGQKSLAGVALTNNTQNSIAQAMAQSQDRFNALRSQAATAGINAENARAQRDMAALQYNDQMYQYAAAARQNLMRDYLAQIPAMIGTYTKGAATSRRHQDMMNLYQQGIDADVMKYLPASVYEKLASEYFGLTT